MFEGTRGGAICPRTGLMKKRIVFVGAHYKHVRMQNKGIEVSYKKWPCDTPTYDPVRAKARTRYRKFNEERPAMGI